MARVALWADKQLPLRRSNSTRPYICTSRDVQFCASARASACGKSKQRQSVRVDEISLLFSALADMSQTSNLSAEITGGDFSKLVLCGTRTLI